MIIKDVAELENLYDLSGLSIIDNEGEVIITDIAALEQDAVFFEKTGSYQFIEKIAILIRNTIKSNGSKIKTGDIILVTNEDYSRKIYCIISVVCGQIVPYILYDVDYDKGTEQVRNFSKSDVEFLMQYPMFQDHAELIFFITKLRNIFSEDASTENRSLIQTVKTYLDKGLWAAHVEGYYSSPAEIAEKLGLKLISESDVIYEKDGKYLAFYDYNLYGSYELVKAAFCEVASATGQESLLYTIAFGGMFNNSEAGLGMLMTRMVDFESDIALLTKPKPVEKTEAQVTSEIIQAQEEIKNEPPVIEEDFFAKAEAELEKAEKETKKQRKKKREDSFSVQSEVSQQEKELAIKETMMGKPSKIVVPKRSRKKQIAETDKALDKILNTPADTYPADWDYVYTIEETSKFYNPTVGQRYDNVSDKMVLDDKQTNGMTIEEWNAYFRAHPELSHLIEPTIGSLGGLFIDEKTLIDSGLLLYNPKIMKFDYIHEYVTGNVYKLIEEFEAIKESFTQTYGQDIYDKQMDFLLSKRPAMKSITAANPKDVPYIHPLDEVIVEYKINSAANVTFYNSQNNAIMNAEKKRLENEIAAKNIDRKDYEILIEDFGNKLQSLSIVVFFKEWLSDQVGKLAAYGLPDINMVDGLYFFGMSYNTFAEEIVRRGIVIVPKDKKPTDVVTYSDYFEAKDSSKRFVNELFQEFLLNEITDEDRKNIEYAWNKRYNGYVTTDIWKLPIFIRHSKYFKDRTRRNKLKLSTVQVTGIKFATVDNSSIMAHEVGYGKCQNLDALLLTPSGWVRMGDIKKGDSVISVDGKPTKVLGIYPQGKKDMYRVTFDDGSSTECCDEHLWTYKSIHNRHPDRKSAKEHGWNFNTDWQTATLRELMDKGIKNKRGNKRFNIPVVEPVHFDKKDLPVHPYLLGILIGDGSFGSSGTITLTSEDEHIVEKIKLLLPNNELKVKQINSTTRRKINYIISRDNNKGVAKQNEVSAIIKKLGLIGKHSNTKFIPDIYKFTSVEDRIQLLQGLMDTDGTTKLVKGRNSSQLSYTTVSEKLKDDVVFLVRSLGGIATVYSRKPKYTYKGEKKIGRLAYTISVNLPPHILPFSLPRKLEKHIPKHKYKPARFISNIEYIGKKEAQCIKVAHESHLYVTDDFIVTHNTLVAIGYMSHCFETGQASNFLVNIPKTLYVNRKWREEITGHYDKARDRYIVGAVPVYNIIELGNFSTTGIWGGGESEYKTYSNEEVEKVNKLLQLFNEIGARQVGRKASKSQGTAAVPTNPYNFRLAVANSNYAWIKLIETILPGIDKTLMYRSVGRSYDENKAILDLMSGFNLGTSAKDKQQNLSILSEKIIDIRWFYQNHLPVFGPDIDFKGYAAYDDPTRRKFERFRDNQLPNPFEKDENGKVVWESVPVLNDLGVQIVDAAGNPQVKDVKKRRPMKAVYEDFITVVLEDLHEWIGSVIQRMSDFAIYEYGQWKFTSGTHNIILSTKEALQNLGFSSTNIKEIVNVVSEITTYRHEEALDAERTYTITYKDEEGEIKQFRRKPESVLQKQLDDLIRKISSSMTEEGPRGKFFLDNLKIDGFILDEAHIAKKIFTNVKTNAFIRIDLGDGKGLSIKTTSHDVRGGAAPEQALSVFGICQYIRSIGSRKPIMLLTATPFSNQPTEIFSMLSLVGINQLREYGISNIKNFFDLFLKETLKFDFDHNGEFIKRITVEDFRNKELLVNLIWSVMDIRRESSQDKTSIEERYFGDKPIRKVFPKLIAESSKETIELAEQEEDYGLNECEQLGNVSTIAVVNKLSLNTCSIVDQNDVQKKMLADIEKVVSAEVNPSTQLEYTFDDICPNVAIFNEIEKERGRVEKTEEEEERDTVTVALRTILNTNIKQIPNGINVETYEDAEKAMPDMEYGALVFVANDRRNTGVGKWAIYKKIRTKGKLGRYGTGKAVSIDDFQKVTDQDKINETLKVMTKKKDYGVTFKAMGISRAVALSPYLFRCNDLPEPTAENVVKYSPKLEFLVKALKSVKDYHINEIPKKIKDLTEELNKIEAIKKPSRDDEERRSKILKDLPQLDSAREVSGQVVYMNMIRFNYYSRTQGGKAKVIVMNLAELLKEYLVKKGWFSENEVQVVSSETRDSIKEQYIKDFQDGKIKVLFGTPAIKEGVDLQNKASTMYIMTPDWNPTDMRQIEGRIWRRDNENKYVRIVYVLLDQSIEVFIYAKLEEKARRLQQIMKERNTVAELEEMSLNPNETKVALASDPEKRADIVTKLCQAVLFDQRNKINKNREELNRLNADLGTVYENIEIIKNNYLIPYHEIIPDINKRYFEHQMQSIVSLFKNDKSRFTDKFAEYAVGGKGKEGFSKGNPVFKDDTLTLALSTIVQDMSIDAILYFITTSNNDVLQDILNGLEIGIENRDAIVKDAIENHNGSISWNTITGYMPMMHSTEMFWRTVEDYLIGPYKYYYSVRYFKLPYVLFCYTDEMRAKLLALIKEIKQKQAKAQIHKYDIRDMFQNLSVVFNKELRDYAVSSPLVKPENFQPYIDARKSKDNAVIELTADQFDAKDLFGKITAIQFFYEELDKAMQSFTNTSVETKRDIIKGVNKTPVKSEVLVKLGMADEDKAKLRDIWLQVEDVFRPVLKTKNVLREVEVTFLKAHGLTIDDLPVLAEKQNEEYNAVTQKIQQLETSRQKLIERFKKANEHRKSVTIDQIVESFSFSNSLLETKLFKATS